MRLLAVEAVPYYLQLLCLLVFSLVLLGISVWALLAFFFFSSTLLLAHWILNVASVFRRKKLAAQKQPLMILQGIAPSHFTEKVRWCLDVIGEPYVEEQDLGVLGIVSIGRSVPRLCIPGANTYIGDSSEILRYLCGLYGHTERGKFLRPDDMVRALELEMLFNKMAVSFQIYVYYYRTRDRDATIKFWGEAEPSVPQWQKLVMKAVYPLCKGFIFNGLRITPASAQSAFENIEKTFAEVESILSDGRTHLLGTDQFTFVDIVWASLAGPAVRHANYGGGRLTKVWPLPSEVEAAVAQLKAAYPAATALVVRMADARPQSSTVSSMLLGV